MVVEYVTKQSIFVLFKQCTHVVYKSYTFERERYIMVSYYFELV